MDYGFSMPHRGPLAHPDAQRELAAAGERLGFATITVSDHIVIPRNIASKYPYTQTGDFPGSRSGESMEQLSLLAFLAAITTKARLLTSVMVLPHRNPLVTAKALATIDVLSKGRVTVGVGVGWLREEFEAIGAPPFDERGAVADEYLRVFKALWCEEDPTFQGRFASFSNVSALPRPVQRPHPPIWIGGESGPAFRRVVEHGDCWYPIGNNPRLPLDSLERYGRALEQLHRATEKAGREPGSIDLAYSAPWYAEKPETVDGKRRMLTGPAADVAADIAALKRLGVRHLFLNLSASSVGRSIDRMERFMAEVAPLVG